VRRLGLVLVALLALAAPAQATEHRMKVNEVGLSVEGGRYVELLDVFGEPFPSLTYKVAVYDGAGNPVGSTDIPKTTISGRTTPVLVASQATVGGQNRDVTLTAPLPADGQACFESNTTKIACMSWGTVTTKVMAMYETMATGASPPAGKSLQRCESGAVVNDPTPKAENNCTTGGGSGGGGGGGTGGSTTDTTKPRATLSARVQKLGAVLAFGYKFKVKSDEKAKARAQLLRKGKVLLTSTKSLTAGVFKAFSLRPPKATRDALKRKQSATFVLKIRVTDVAGNVRNVTRTLRLTR
jgi:hypothetical protein